MLRIYNLFAATNFYKEAKEFKTLDANAFKSCLLARALRNFGLCYALQNVPINTRESKCSPEHYNILQSRTEPPCHEISEGGCRCK